MAVVLRRRIAMTGGRRGELGANLVELLGAAEEERAVDAEDGDEVGDEFALEDVDLVAGDVFFRDAGDGGGGGDFADEDEGGEDHAGLDGDGEVGEDGEQRRW